MSYLHLPRLVFSGDFLSDVSTVNNDTAHYNNTTFTSNFQKPGQGATNGWWNPEGGAVFDFQNCEITQAFLPDGSQNAGDLIMGLSVQGASGRPTGKMVDLDPDSQMVSALWCVQLRICDKDNNELLRGDMETTCFRDLQMRQTNGGKPNGQPLGASWTSVLKNLVFSEKADSSPIISALKSETQGNKLSVNLNGFGYYYSHADGRFSLGKLLGTIGPWYKEEPDTFAACRRLYGSSIDVNTGGTFFAISNFLYQEDKKRVDIDLGASFPVVDSMGTIAIKQKLILAVSRKPVDFVPSKTTKTFYLGPPDFIKIGEIDYQSKVDWLNQTCGIVSFDKLSSEITKTLKNSQLLLLTPSTLKPGEYTVLARESIDGLLVRADNFVQRIDCGDINMVKFYTYQWGQPLPNQQIHVTMNPPTQNTPKGKGSNPNPVSIIYGNNTPQNGLSFQNSITTNAEGNIELEIIGNPIHSPRHYIDGQIYFIDYQLAKVDPAFTVESLSIHLRDYFEVPENPVWSDISEIMIQYSNLYPIMSKYLVNLGDPVSLKAKKKILIFAFSQDINNTMHMPVTRDLSKSKRETILKWLNGPDDNIKIDKMKIDKMKVASLEKIQDSEFDVQTPSEQYLKYKEAVKAKNGSMTEFKSTDTLFENL